MTGLSNTRKRQAQKDDQVFLNPVSRLQEFHPHACKKGCVLKEYRLAGVLRDIKAFFDLLQCLEEELVVWTSNRAFVLSGNLRSQFLVEGDFEFGACQFVLHFVHEEEHENSRSIAVYGATLEDAVECFDFFVGLEDPYYDEMTLSLTKNLSHLSYIRGMCPLGESHIQRILQNSKNRNLHVMTMNFTSAQCRAFATAGVKTNIHFINCGFQDEGESFVNALCSREEASVAGPIKLGFSTRVPFSSKNWNRLLTEHHLDVLELCHMNLCAAYSSVLGFAYVEHLVVDSCRLAGIGETLRQAGQTQQGPRNLTFTHSQGTWALARPYINALRGNARLRRLSFSFLGFSEDEEALETIVGTIIANHELENLSLKSLLPRQAVWDRLTPALCRHPSIRSFDMSFSNQPDESFWDQDRKLLRTETLAFLLTRNSLLEIIKFYDGLYDRNLWDTHIAQKLEANYYETRFSSMAQNIDSPAYPALLGAALCRTKNEAVRIVWALVHRNQGVVAVQLSQSNESSVGIKALVI